LEAALVHFRCLITFVGHKHGARQVKARDYAWTISGSMVKMGKLNRRVAFLAAI